MCQNLTILASDDAAHTIAQCEHGTIHVFWVRAVLFLHPDDLLPLLALVQRWQPSYDVTKSDGFTILRQANGRLQFWYHEVGLCISETELYGLAQLLWQAAGNLNLLTGETSQPRQGLAWYRQLTSVTARPECRN